MTEKQTTETTGKAEGSGVVAENLGSESGDKREPRQAGPLEEPTTEEDKVSTRELIDDTLAAGGEVVASDGEQELIQFPPILVNGDGWHASMGKKRYAEKVLFKLGDVAAPVEIAGFALFDKDDAQVAWCGLPTPITVHPNTTIGVEDSIVF